MDQNPMAASRESTDPVDGGEAAEEADPPSSSSGKMDERGDETQRGQRGEAASNNDVTAKRACARSIWRNSASRCVCDGDQHHTKSKGP